MGPDIVEHVSRRNDDDSEQAAQVLATGHNLTMFALSMLGAERGSHADRRLYGGGSMKMSCVDLNVD